jgi:hypothetical protein
LTFSLLYSQAFFLFFLRMTRRAEYCGLLGLTIVTSIFFLNRISSRAIFSFLSKGGVRIEDIVCCSCGCGS